MGNQQVKELSYDEIRTMSNFEGEINEDFRYGSGLIIYNPKLSMRFLLQTQTYTLLSQYNKKMQEAQLRSTLIIPTLLQLIKFNGQEYINTYGKSFKISLLYEFQNATLQDMLIEIEQKSIAIFDENKLFSICDGVLANLLIFKHYGIQHGFIQPSTILVKNSIFMLNDIAFMSGTNEYRRLMSGIQQGCYLSPELFRELGQRANEPVHDTEKSEIFSLGLTILESALVTNLSWDVYDYDTFKVREQVIDNYISKFAGHIHNLLRGMLEVNPDKRQLAEQNNLRFSYLDLLNVLEVHLESSSYALMVYQEIQARKPQVEQTSRQISPLSFRNQTQQADLDNFYQGVVKQESQIDQNVSSRGGDKKLIGVKEMTLSGRNTNSGIKQDSEQETFRTSRFKQTTSLIPQSGNKARSEVSPKPNLGNSMVKSPGKSMRRLNETPPQSPLMKIKRKKSVSQKPPSVPKTPPTMKKIVPQVQYIVQNEEVDDKFRYLESKIEQLNESKYQHSRQYSAITTYQELESRLPQSDVIHMHSGDSQFINDVFGRPVTQKPKQKSFWD